MAKLIFSKKAIEDLSDIWEYSFKNWSENQADVYYQGILVSCRIIIDNPNIGKSYPEVLSDLLGFISNEHVIFYKKAAKSNTVEIIRILHGRMNLKNKLLEKHID